MEIKTGPVVLSGYFHVVMPKNGSGPEKLMKFSNFPPGITHPALTRQNNTSQGELVRSGFFYSLLV